MRTEVDINAEMLTWAIARAGYDLHDFVIKVPSIFEWIQGKKKPTVKQLEDFSKKVYLPFGYFFLPEPPKEKLPIPFFRTNNTQATQVSVNVYDTILLLQQRQDWLKDYLKESEFETLSFVGKYRNSNNVQEIVADLRRSLNLSENLFALLVVKYFNSGVCFLLYRFFKTPMKGLEKRFKFSYFISTILFCFELF